MGGAFDLGGGYGYTGNIGDNELGAAKSPAARRALWRKKLFENSKVGGRAGGGVDYLLGERPDAEILEVAESAAFGGKDIEALRRDEAAGTVAKGTADQALRLMTKAAEIKSRQTAEGIASGTIAAPPQADATDSYLRALSRMQTDRMLRQRPKGRAF